MCGEPVSSQLLHCTETTNTTSSWPENTLRTAPRLLSPPTPSHSIPQKQPACVHNFSCLLLWPQNLSEAFCIHPRDKQVSLVPPPKPPSPHHSLWTAMLHKLAGGPRDVTAAKPAGHPTACKITSHYWARKESPNPTNVLTWSWHEGTGDLPGSTCSGAQLSQARSVSPKSSCSSAHREDLSAFSSVMLPLPCIRQKTPYCVWPPAENLPTQRRGPQVGAMLLSLIGGVPLCCLVKPILKQPVTYVQGLCHLIQVI